MRDGFLVDYDAVKITIQRAHERAPSCKEGEQVGLIDTDDRKGASSTILEDEREFGTEEYRSEDHCAG